MKLSKWASSLTVIALAVSLAACETKRVNQAMGRVDQNAERADYLTGSLRKQQAPTHPTVSFSDDQYVTTKPLSMKSGLPPSRDCDVVYNESKSLQQFAQWVSETCNIQVRISPDALDGGASLSKNRTATAPMAPPPAITSAASISELFPTGAVPRGSSYSSQPVSGGSTYLSGVKYVGKLSGLLDTVTGSLGLSWRYEPATNGVKIYYADTRSFSIFAFNKSSTFKSEVKSGMTSSAGTSTSGGSGGTSSSGVTGDSGSTQTTQVDMHTSILDDIENNVKNMLTLDRMSFSRATGIMTVTDRPDVLDRVQAYVDTENTSITKQVLINVEVLSITLEDKDQYGIDWTLVYKSVGGKFGFGLTNSFPGVDASAVSSSISILDTSSSPFAGSKAVIQALSEQGRVSSYRAPSVTTLNLQSAPVQIGKVQGYLASSSTTNSANVGSTATLTPGSITSGFNMSLTPLVMPANQMLLQLAINMTGNPTFIEQSSGDSKIQNPNYDLQIFNQSVKLRSGQTLILSGFDQTDENASKSGTGNANFWGLGGGGTRDTNRNVVVLMITPIMMD